MKLNVQNLSPGEHPFSMQGAKGNIEAILTIPEESITTHVAVLGHPHSLQGGTMNNKVVTTMARAFKALNIPSVRFNFRGVGLSEGSYEEGVGESEDMLELTRFIQQSIPESKPIFAGFSFGSYVAYRAAAQHEHALLITIAPPVHHYDYEAFAISPSPWVVLIGEVDEVVPPQLVIDFADNKSPNLPLLKFPDTGHFFHRKLIDLKDRLIEEIKAQVPSI